MGDEGMECINCGKVLVNGSVFGGTPMCRKCAVKVTVKELFLYLLIPLAVAGFLYYMAELGFAESTNRGIFTFMLVGFPFGVRRMFLWIVPFGGHSVAASVMILLLNIIGGAVIGWAILVYRVVTTFFKTIYRVIKILTFRPAPAQIAE